MPRDIGIAVKDVGGLVDAVLAGEGRSHLGEVRRGGPGRAALADLGAERADGGGEVLHLWRGGGGIVEDAAAGRL